MNKEKCKKIQCLFYRKRFNSYDCLYNSIYPNCPFSYVKKESPLNQQIGGDHYINFKIQPSEFIHKNQIGFLPGSIIKRACRYQKKNGLEDLKKIIHEAKLIAWLEYGETL